MVAIKKTNRVYKKKRSQTFAIYIYRVLKRTCPDFGISKKGMCVINSIAFDVFEQVALEASKLVRYQKKKTLTGQDIQSAVKLLLPVDLGNHAVVEGGKAVSKFNGNKK